MAVYSTKSVAGATSQALDGRDFLSVNLQTADESGYNPTHTLVDNPAACSRLFVFPERMENRFSSFAVPSAWTRFALLRSAVMVSFDIDLGIIEAGLFSGFALFNNGCKKLMVSEVSTESEFVIISGIEAGDRLGPYSETSFSITITDEASGTLEDVITITFDNGESVSITLEASLTLVAFPFRIDYSSNVKVRWLNSLDAHHLSPAPLGYLDGQQTARKRRLSISLMASSTDVTDIEDFFEDIGCKSFWLADLPRDFKNAVGSENILYVESGDLPSCIDDDFSYAVSCMPHDGSDPILARITGIEEFGDGYNITLENPLDVEVTSEAYEISFAVLVSVDSDTCSFSPISSNLWTVSLDLTEQPYETVSPLQNITIYYRYTFSQTDHLGNSLWHKYTTEAESDDYTPIDIVHDDLSFGLFTDDNKCTISLKAADDGPFCGWTPFWLGPPVNLSLKRVSVVNSAETETVIFSGECTGIVRQGQSIEATFEPRSINGKIPNFFASARDNIDPWRTHDISLHGYSLNVIGNYGSNKISVTWSNSLSAEILENGYLVFSGGTLAEVRDILLVTKTVGTEVELRINGPVSAEVGDTVTCYRGYDGSADSYVALFGSIAGFGGHPMITTTNPSFDAIKMETSTGKK